MLFGQSAFAEYVSPNGFVSDINKQRVSRGIRSLAVASDLASYAREHSERMAARGEIFHSDDAEFSSIRGWSIIGENVGMGGSVEDLNRAFMDSPDHRANILYRSFNQLGVGAVSRDGVIYVTEIFVARASAPVSRVSRPASRAAAPRPVAPAPRKAAPAAPVAPSRSIHMLMRLLAIMELDVPHQKPRIPNA